MQVLPPASPQEKQPRIEDLVLLAASSTLDALVRRGHLKEAERNHIEGVHLQGIAEGKETEVFETITRLSTVPPREIADFMAGLGLAVAKTMRERIPLIPNLGRVPKPSAFFSTYPQCFEAARALLCPVLYCEDDEVVGVGSVNPIPALHFGRIVSEALSAATSTRPFVSVVRLDYDTWRTLLQKQFSL